MKETGLIKIENNIFVRIKNFFKNLFKINKTEEVNIGQVEEQEVKNTILNTNNFKQNIKIEEDKEKTRLLKLQQEFSEGKITEEEMSEEDVESLHELYDEQIAQIEESTERYKKRILEIRKKLQEN